MLPESDLWVVPPSNHSAWFARLDWYLNWQMCKGLAHRPMLPCAEVESLANEYGIPIPYAQVADPGPLLISTRGLVPAEKCIVLPYNMDLNGWVRQAASIATSLGVTRLCIFLPAGTPVDSGLSVWSNLGSNIEVSFIMDQEESK